MKWQVTLKFIISGRKMNVAKTECAADAIKLCNELNKETISEPFVFSYEPIVGSYE